MTKAIRRGFDRAAAAAHLASDRRLARWMRQIELPPPAHARSFDPVDALARSILYQQLSGKAAATITGRVESNLPPARRGSPRISREGLDSLDDESLRSSGVSRQKIAALRDLAAKAGAGVVPSTRQMAWMDDEAIVARLTQVRGIGRWTVEMLLIFRLGRPDILPLADLGIRKGAQLLGKSDQLPTVQELERRGAVWAPYRSLASLYLWQIADAGAANAVKVRRSQD